MIRETLKALLEPSPSILISNEEYENLFDVFSVCALTLKEESDLADQCFTDLVRDMPDNPQKSKPVAGVDVEAQNHLFRAMLARLDICNAEQLAEVSGATLESCTALLGNPITCEPSTRAEVIRLLEESIPLEIWYTSSSPETTHSKCPSVGDVLHHWARANFVSPLQHERQAVEYDTKCNLIGAVGCLSDDELKRINQRDPLEILKEAAA